MIVYEIFKAIFVALVTFSTGLGLFIFFDEEGLIFPDGFKNADLCDWGIAIFISISVFFVSVCIGGTISMIL